MHAAPVGKHQAGVGAAVIDEMQVDLAGAEIDGAKGDLLFAGVVEGAGGLRGYAGVRLAGRRHVEIRVEPKPEGHG